MLWETCGWNLILVDVAWYLLYFYTYIVYNFLLCSNNSTSDWGSTQQHRNVISWQALSLQDCLGFKYVAATDFYPCPHPSSFSKEITIYRRLLAFFWHVLTAWLTTIRANIQSNYIIWYSWFHKKGTFSVNSFNDDYESIHERTGS